jgi:hypothetical protein
MSLHKFIPVSFIIIWLSLAQIVFAQEEVDPILRPSSVVL